jgi:hypothetical protein
VAGSSQERIIKTKEKRERERERERERKIDLRSHAFSAITGVICRQPQTVASSSP